MTGAVLLSVIIAATNLVPKASAPGHGVGWPEHGEMALSFEQAKIKLGVKAQAEGWLHVHTITLGKDRVLEAWDRGGEEMTLMVWRISAGRSGWSRGVTAKAKTGVGMPTGKGNGR